ncbi:MAG: 16S rRNA (adenine(1518)-N(6)/adenine(1519)-N(6))-dimethyltransferase RsmA [Elusimicrobiota bacterium]
MKRIKFGQNYLVDKKIAENIVDCAQLTPEDTVIEIGPGQGVLTELIAPKVSKLICVEIDPELVVKLKNSFKNQKNTEIVHADFLNWTLPGSATKVSKYKLISNLPYYITSPILRKTLAAEGWSWAVFMVQKEVGERILADLGTRHYGVLTLIVKYYSAVEKGFDVDKSCFKPVPEVDSTVLKFTRKTLNQNQLLISEKLFFRVIKAAFSQRRKTVLNSMSAGLNLPKEVITEILSKNGIDPSIRPERICLDKFISLAIDLKSII